MIQQDIKKNILSDIKSLPAMSPTTRNIIALFGSSDVDLSEIVTLIQYDPALTSNVLKLVNSAYFGVQTKVTSIRQATVLLGLNQVYRIVVAVSFSTLLNRPIAGYDLPAGELWRHSVATAIASETIASMLDFPEQDLAFTAALLHDIGKIVLSTFVDTYFDRIDAEARASGDSFEVVEKRFFGIDHAEAGSLTLKSWGIPHTLYLPVQWHHAPGLCDRDDVARIVDIVHLADSLTLTQGIGVGREGLHYRPTPEVVSRLKCNTAMMESIISKTMTGMESLDEIFNLQETRS